MAQGVEHHGAGRRPRRRKGTPLLLVVCLFQGHRFEWVASDFDVVPICSRCAHVST